MRYAAPGGGPEGFRWSRLEIRIKAVIEADGMQNCWYVYIVQCSDDSLYTGVARDVERRIRQHNDGRGAKYTRARRPVRLVHSEPAADRGSALRREQQIKRMTRLSKKRLIAGGRTHWTK